MRDITLSYSGGSGGFLLLHLLLLSGKFYASFENKRSPTDIIQSQWNITNHKKWKTYETWPNNDLTQLATTSLRKLYFVCNPESNLVNSPSKQLLLYTDASSQFKLAFFKRAYWFIDDDTSKSFPVAMFKINLKHWNNFYNDIKDPSWPKCLSFRHIDRLPIYIQQELLASEHIQQFLNLETYLTTMSAEYYKNELVYSPILPFLNSADMVVKLQDVVNSDGKVLEELLEIPTMNNKQHKLIERWKKLHPQELLEKIGITPSS